MILSSGVGKDQVRRQALDRVDAAIENELWKAGLYPDVANPVVDLESFIEQYLQARLDLYASLPAGILGQTEFFRDDAPLISINRVLTEAAVDAQRSLPGVLGRWRATIAHEVSHVIFHRPGSDAARQAELFGSTSPEPRQTHFRCGDVFFRGGGRNWREVDANRGMASLLMPRRLFQVLAVEEIARLNLGPADRVADQAGAWRLIAALSERIHVSKQAVSIRLETLSLIALAGQEQLVHA